MVDRGHGERLVAEPRQAEWTPRGEIGASFASGNSEK
jgi:hypothetical protein